MFVLFGYTIHINLLRGCSSEEGKKSNIKIIDRKLPKRREKKKQLTISEDLPRGSKSRQVHLYLLRVSEEVIGDSPSYLLFIQKKIIIKSTRVFNMDIISSVLITTRKIYLLLASSYLSGWCPSNYHHHHLLSEMMDVHFHCTILRDR